MYVTIKRVHGNRSSGFDLDATEVVVHQLAGVVELKAAYIETGHSGDTDYICLYYKGVEMQDDAKLADYGVKHGAVVFHQAAILHPYAPVAYKALAREFAEEHRSERCVRPPHARAPRASPAPALAASGRGARSGATCRSCSWTRTPATPP